MFKLVIVGGGFAGFWSAMSAVREIRSQNQEGKLEIHLIAKDQYHTIRPRLYEKPVDEIRVPLENFCTPLGIKLMIADVTGIDPKKSSITVDGRDTPVIYDALILAAGSHLKKPDIPGFEKTFNIDTFDAALRLEDHIQNLSNNKLITEATRNIVVVGGGASGIELATMMPEKLKNSNQSKIDFNIHLIDRNPKIVFSYTQEGQQYIQKRLNDIGVKQYLGEEIKCIESNMIMLESGNQIESETVVWTAGVESNKLSNNFNEKKDNFGRLEVDQFLRLPNVKNIFIAGDMAKVLVDDKNFAPMTCQHAMPQGKFAGHNAVCSILGVTMKPYSQPKYLTCLNLGEDDALFTSGWERRVQMTGLEANALKAQINTMWIYPMDDVEKNLEMSFPTIEEVG